MQTPCECEIKLDHVDPVICPRVSDGIVNQKRVHADTKDTVGYPKPKVATQSLHELGFRIKGLDVSLRSPCTN
jgi:hypothetical protein